MAILDPSDDVMQDPPYNILVLAGDSAQGYHFYNYSGSSLWHPDARGLSGGTIAGIVIGIIAFIALVLGALWYTKKRKNDKNSVQRTYRSMPVSSQPTDAHVATSYMTSVNHSQTSSILIETGSVPDEYRDSSRPDIRPLTYYGTHIKYAELSNDELQALEPDVAGPLYLFSGKYTSGEEEKVTYLRDGYAIRTFVDADDGIKHTIHYFSASNLKTFVRSVNAVLSCTKSQYIMKSKQGIVLCKPTSRFNYQYIWITSPMIPEHSLYYLLFERKTWTFVDHHNPDYKIWSIYAVLKSVETLHASKFVHLAIDLKAFYYDDETKATDWRLGNFGYAQPTNGGQKAAVEADAAPHTAFTAPEVIRNGSPSCHHGGEASDVWSVACVIYTIATGGGLLFENDTQVKNLITFNDDMKQHLKISVRDNIENQVFKSILQDMLQVDPTQRKSIAKVLDDWNLIYNMEE
ncbi:kinase-like domain-containing protein [Helicostylum pulchrum]|nr:kinase-like domain-containing protein [Helicostylum pulchrum]